MKTIKTAALIITSIVCLCICANAGAQNNKKSQESGKEVVELTLETFSTKIYDGKSPEMKYLGDKPAIVDFTASWCGPCQRLAPILEDLAKEYKGKVSIYKVDVDKYKELAQAFNVSSIPAVLFIPMEGEPKMIVGLRGKEAIKKDIDSFLLGK